MSDWIEKKYINMFSHHLPQFHWKGDNAAIFRCIYCGDSQKNKTKCRGYIYTKGQRWIYYCHNCTISTTIAKVLKQFDPTLYREYCLEKFRPGYSDAPITRALVVPKVGNTAERFVTATRCDRLPETHDCVKYLQRRCLPNTTWSRLYYTEHYKQFLDEVFPDHGKAVQDDARLIIPYRDIQGALQAVSGRSLSASSSTLRYITVRDKSLQDTTKLVFGIEQINQSQCVYLTEGPLDSLFITNAVASGDANLIGAAQRLSASQIVLIYDNEPRNVDIVGQMGRALKAGHQVVIWPSTIKGKDINEMIQHGATQSEIKSVIDSTVTSGIVGLTKLVFWKKCMMNKGVLA
jgi:hypothetical protein